MNATCDDAGGLEGDVESSKDCAVASQCGERSFVVLQYEAVLRNGLREKQGPAVLTSTDLTERLDCPFRIAMQQAMGAALVQLP